MDSVHIHLLLTHFPIIGTIIGVVILAYGQFYKNDTVKKVSLVLFIIMAIFTIPVFLTGEGAEESVESLTGVSENIIEEHEGLAKNAIWLMGFLGIISLAGFYSLIKKISFSKTITLIILIVSLATAGLFSLVGNLGGQIRHTEIRTTNTNNQQDNYNQLKQPNTEEEEEHEDE